MGTKPQPFLEIYLRSQVSAVCCPSTPSNNSAQMHIYVTRLIFCGAQIVNSNNADWGFPDDIAWKDGMDQPKYPHIHIHSHTHYTPHTFTDMHKTPAQASPIHMRVRLQVFKLKREVCCSHFTFCFFVISSDRIFDESRIWMAASSSRMLPSEDERVCKMLSSISLSCRRLAALVTMRACRSSSSSGLKFGTYSEFG